MDITFLGDSSFKIKGKSASVVTGADVTVSRHNEDRDKVVNGPGEYEIAGVSIIGIQTFHDKQSLSQASAYDNKNGAERGKNTIYVIEIDGIRLLHAGDLGHKLTDDQIKEIGTIDILFVPVDGTYNLDPKLAVEVVRQVGPSIVIPMHYKDEELNEFLKESALRVEKLPKLSIKEGDINSEEEYAIVLEKK